MKLKYAQCTAPKRADCGFTIADALFAMAIAGVMFTALYAGLAFGFKVIRLARENTRAIPPSKGHSTCPVRQSDGFVQRRTRTGCAATAEA